jgi:hypothetical protein
MYTGGSERLRIDTSGNVGIGTATTTYRLNVSGTTFTSGMAVGADTLVGSYTNSVIGASRFQHSAAPLSLVNTAGTYCLDIIGASNTYAGRFGYTSDNLLISVNNAERMRITSAGNVGIGTSSPSSKLSITSANNEGIHTTNGTQVTKLFNSTSITAGALWVTSNDALSFGTNNAERMRLDASGALIIGATAFTPQTGKFKVVHDTGNQNIATSINSAASSPYGDVISFTGASPNNGTNYFLLCADTTATRAQFYSNGGLANYSANNVNLSDRREKTNFAPATSYLDKICAIPVQTFNYLDQNLEQDDGLTLGVVAQDVQAIAPELVTETNWGTVEEPKIRLSIYQTDLQYALMKCIQEQQALINTLTERISVLENK